MAGRTASSSNKRSLDHLEYGITQLIPYRLSETQRQLTLVTRKIQEDAYEYRFRTSVINPKSMPVREEGVQCHVEGPGCVDKQVNKEVSAATRRGRRILRYLSRDVYIEIGEIFPARATPGISVLVTNRAKLADKKLEKRRDTASRAGRHFPNEKGLPRCGEEI